MLYDPREVFNLRSILGGSLISAAQVAAADFITGNNKPWLYYAGVAFGAAAAATSIPGFTATIYAVGDSVDALFFKSPDGSQVRVWLNGIAHSTFDTYAAAVIWETFNINGLIGGVVNRLDFEVVGASVQAGATGIPWCAISTITVNNSTNTGYALEAQNPMSLYNVSFSILDSDGDTDTAAFKFIATDHTIEQIQEAASTLAGLIDDCIDGQITAIAITLEATLPGGLKSAPVANCENQKGGLFSLTLEGSPYKDSVRLPALTESLFVGKNVNVTAPAATAAFVTAMTAGITVLAGADNYVVVPANRFEFPYLALASATKSFRK